MDDRTLRAEVAELAFGYVMSGTLSRDWFADQIAAETIPDRFREYERLVNLHVALDEDVTEYVQTVQQQLRRIKTETRRERHQSRDAVEGRIDWPDTYQSRYQQNPDDRTLFVMDRRQQNYDVPENRVLKRLLSIVYETVKDLDTLDRDWVDERWESADRDEIEEFKRLYDGNVHLGRIDTPTPPHPTDRDVRAAKSSRKDFYRTAARHLEWRRELASGDEDALRELFDSSVIQASENRLFELFVVLKLLEGLENWLDTDPSRVRTLSGGGHALTAIGDPPVSLFHESSASDRDLRFPPMPTPDEETVEEHDYRRDPSERDEEWLVRSQAVSWWSKLVERELWDTDGQRHTGRPDAVLARQQPDSGQGPETLVVEVKNSSNRKTIDRGVRELLRYLAFAQSTVGSEDTFLLPGQSDSNPFRERTRGLLVVRGLGSGTEDVQLEGPIEVVPAARLDDRLGTILPEALESR